MLIIKYSSTVMQGKRKLCEGHTRFLKVQSYYFVNYENGRVIKNKTYAEHLTKILWPYKYVRMFKINSSETTTKNKHDVAITKVCCDVKV